MRLINSETLELSEHAVTPRGPYVILSHTWEEEEVNYQEMTAPTAETYHKKGYKKITETCRRAWKEKIQWVWIDTCCIDKTSSAELTEAINSMYEWYRTSSKCYVYLSDLNTDESAGEHMGRCRWFTRGWTLQELLAPRVIDFFDQNWKRRGSKDRFIKPLSERTGISSRVLMGQKAVRDCSIATRMSWASQRNTTREEDEAYCLLGIFEVSMPLLYGERARAFRRLQEAIIQRNNDLTVFAWDQTNVMPDASTSRALDLLAPTPAAFTGKADVAPFTDDFLGFQVTNKGLFISGEFPLRTVEAVPTHSLFPKLTYELYLGSNGYRSEDVGGICLRKVGPGLFHRDSTFPLVGFGTNETRHVRSLQTRDCHVIIDPSNNIADLLLNFRRQALYVPNGADWNIKQVVPENLWDASDHIFLRPKPYTWIQYETVIAIEVNYTILDRSLRLAVLCDLRRTRTTKVFDITDDIGIAALIFTPKKWDRGVMWTDLEVRAPVVLELCSFVDLTIHERRYRISTSLDRTSFTTECGPVELLSLQMSSAQTTTSELNLRGEQNSEGAMT